MFQLKPIHKKELLNIPWRAKVLKPKVKVGHPGDKFEQEADAAADRVMRMSESETIRMQPIEEEEEILQPKLRMQPVEEEEKLLQTKSGIEDNFASSEIDQQINSSKGNGKPLPPKSNRFMSNAFGSDFSGVQIHTGQKASQINQQLGARAFTYGNNIFFNNGEYNPHSNRGKKLLAHELTHVVQQKDSNEKPIQRDRTGDRETEREAERGRRRRDTIGGRDRGRSLGGDLDSDWAGRAILGRWLTGSGDWNILNNSSWSAYMMASSLLREQLTEKVHEIVAEGITTADTIHQETFAVYENFSAVVENGEGIIGYQYLHGTNADVGGFLIWGEGRIINLPDGQRMVSLNLTYKWNDMIDPNPQYQTDSIKSIFGEIITLGQAESYEIHISWPATSYVFIDSAGNIINSVGYPFY